MNISQVQCPECEKVIPVPPSDSRNVAMLCKHCGSSFIASLLGHINQEETQMATSKKAAKAATKPANVNRRSAASDEKKATVPAKKVSFVYTALFDDNPKRKGSKAEAIFTALKKAGKKVTAEKVLTVVNQKASYTLYDVKDGLYLGIKPGHVQRDTA